MTKFRFILCALGILIFIVHNGYGQKNEGVHTEKIWFSTIPNTPQKSLEPYYKALKTLKKGAKKFSVIEQLAHYHIENSNSDSIVYYGNLYLRDLQEMANDSNHFATWYTKAYHILGIGSRCNGLFDNAIQWHIKGITEGEEVLQREYVIKNQIGLAHNYNLKQQPNKAKDILEKLPTLVDSNWPELLPEIYTHLADAYFQMKNFDQARTYYKLALQNALKTNNVHQELKIRLKFGALEELAKNYDAAFAFYNQAREKGQTKGKLTIYFEGTIRIGELFFREENYDAAIAALSVAYINAIERDNLHYQKEILNIQRKVFAAKKDYSNAYAVMTQLSGIENQISQRQQQKVIKELEIRYETLQKEKAIADLEETQLLKEAEIRRQKTIQSAVLIGALLILIPVLALLYMYFQKVRTQKELHKKQDELNTQELRSLKKEQELQLIKASISAQDEERKRIAQELHDSIGGNLAGIKLQLSGKTFNKTGLKSITDQLDETYQLVRDISHNLIPKKFKQDSFSETVQNYINTFDSKDGLKINLHFNPKKDIDNLREEIQLELYKIIQELLTNAHKHSKAKHVTINLSKADNELSFLFEDDGVGFDLKKATKGLGLQGISRRVQTLKGVLEIDTAPNKGTIISISVDLNEDLETKTS